MAGVTWEATIRLPQNGDQVRVRVVAPTQFDARQLIELQYDDAGDPVWAGEGRFDASRVGPARRGGRSSRPAPSDTF